MITRNGSHAALQRASGAVLGYGRIGLPVMDLAAGAMQPQGLFAGLPDANVLTTYAAVAGTSVSLALKEDGVALRTVTSSGPIHDVLAMEAVLTGELTNEGASSEAVSSVTDAIVVGQL